MHWPIGRIIQLVILLKILCVCASRSTNKDEYDVRHLQLNEKYGLDWWVEEDADIVHFEITLQSVNCFIGFGISEKPFMDGADIVMMWMVNGLCHVEDRHGIGNVEPKIDDRADWFLDKCFSNDTHTSFTFHRAINTCDPQDVEIVKGVTMKFLWSYGQPGQGITYHGSTQRGAQSVDVLSKPNPTLDLSKFTKFTLPIKAAIPPNQTTYYCTVEKISFPTKRHVIAYEMDLSTPSSREFSHHTVLMGCTVTTGSEEEALLEKLAATDGGICGTNSPNNEFDRAFLVCSTYVYTWAVGGEPLILPKNVGFPINEDGQTTYFYTNNHWNNPEKKAGVQMDGGLSIYISEELREEECGLLGLGAITSPLMVIPPRSTNFTVVGHCDPKCTEAKFPPAGVTIINYFLHSHLSGRSIKLRHYRPYVTVGGENRMKELPPIGYDSNYDFNYQQNAQLSKPVSFLPGDQLTVECTYDTTWKRPASTTLGGKGTVDEMCIANIMYYPRIKELDHCESMTNFLLFAFSFGINGMDMESDLWDPIVFGPNFVNGTKFSRVVNRIVDWEGFRNEWQSTSQFGDHMPVCAGPGEWIDAIYGSVGSSQVVNKAFKNALEQFASNNKGKSPIDVKMGYPPNLEIYEPPQSQCSNK